VSKCETGRLGACRAVTAQCPLSGKFSFWTIVLGPMETEAGGAGAGRIQRLLVGLVSSSLAAREVALSGCADMLVDAAALDVKPAALRRLVGAVLGAYMDSCQVTEKKWRLALEALLVRASGLEGLPFSVLGLVLESFREQHQAQAVSSRWAQSCCFSVYSYGALLSSFFHYS